MKSLALVSQTVIALGLLNVWLLRARKPSAWVILAPVHALLLWRFRAGFEPSWSGGMNHGARAGVEGSGGRS